METLYRGFEQRRTRNFFNDAVLADPDALTVTIKKEGSATALTATSVTFSDLNILANKISTGKFYLKITPDDSTAEGVYLVYWKFTYGTGAAAATYVEVDVFRVGVKDESPVYSDNYVSLDALERRYAGIIERAGTPARALYIGDKCSRILDSELDGRFSVPVRVRPDTKAYDEPVVFAVVALTISKILRAKGFNTEADDFESEYEKMKDGINNGRYRLSEETTAKDIGFAVPKPSSANTGTNVDLELEPGVEYLGLYHALLVVQIDGAGDVGVGTFKVSIDSGKTWIATGQASSDVWQSPTGCLGLSLRFFRRAATGNLALGDKWEIEAFPAEAQITKTKGSVRTARARL